MEAIEKFQKNFNKTNFTNINNQLEQTSWLYRKIYNLTYLNDQRLLSIGNLFVKLLDKFETDQTAYNELKNGKNFETLTTLKKEVYNLFEGIGQPAGIEYKSSKIVAEEIRYKIAWRLNALERKINYTTKEIETEIPESLSRSMDKWRNDSNNKTILEDRSSPSRTETSVNQRMKDIKEELKKYPSFVKMLSEHPKLVELMLEWTVRDKLPLDLFIEMPEAFGWIKSHFLATRISKYIETIELIPGPKAYTIEDGDNGFKKLHLPFEGKYIYIHSAANTEIILGTEGKEYNTTLKKIEEGFKNKNVIAGDFEFLPGRGFTNWNGYKLAWRTGIDEKERETKKTWLITHILQSIYHYFVNKVEEDKENYSYVDFKKEGWIKELPLVDRITKDNAEQRYGKEVVEKNKNILSARVSRQNLKNAMEVMRTHSWLEYAAKDDKYFNVYDFGAYPEKYPISLWGLLSFIGGCFKGVIAYFEENIVYLHRQHLFVKPRALEEEEEKRFLKGMGNLLHAAQIGLWAFQFLFHNCSKFVEMVLEHTFDEKFHDLFRAKIIDAKPSGVIGYFPTVLRILPLGIRYLGGLGITLLLGGWRSHKAVNIEGKEILVSMWSKIDNMMELFIPGKPFAQINT